MKKLLSLSAFIGVLVTPVSAYSSEELNTIVITSSRVAEPVDELATSVTVLNREDIEAAGYSSIPELLRTVGSIGVSNSGGEGKATALRIRGEESYRTLVMIDGVDVSDPTGTQVGPKIEHLLLNGDIERIEILRGPQGFVYGADAGGVVNIITTKGVGPTKGSIKVESGSFDTRRVNANVHGREGLFDYFVSVGDSATEGFNTRSDDDTQDEDGYDNTTLHGKFGLNPSDKTRLQLVVRDIESETKFDNCFSGSRFDDCLADYEQTTSKLSFDYTGDLLEQHVAYAYTDIARENFTNGTTSFSTTGDISRVEYWGSLLHSNSRLIYGVDLEGEEVTASSGETQDRDQLGIYLEYKTTMSEKVFLSAGIRQDDNDDFGKYTSERFSLAYLQRLGTGNSIKYRASYGTGFRAPSLSEIAYNNSSFAFGEAADTKLQEETSEGYDLGVDVTLINGSTFSITYFNQDIEDEIFFDLGTFSGYLQATGETESTGVELDLDIPLSLSWQIHSNYTYNDTKDRNGDQRVRRPKQLANLGARYFGLNNKLTLGMNVRLSRDAIDNGDVELENYTVIDVNASYDVTNQLSVFININNLFDREYEEVSNFNTPGRAGYFSLRYNF
jgi:vitamin B12 transporter